MNLSPRWVTYLAGMGLEAEHWSQVGPIAASDETIMAYASSHGYIVLTHDLDFSAILAATHGVRPSVVQLRADNLDPNAIGLQVVSALRNTAAELERGALLSVDPVRTRIRLLPLRSV